MHRFFSATLLAALVCACGGDKPAEQDQYAVDDTAATETEGSTQRQDWSPDLGTAVIRGVAVFEGDAPKARRIDMGGEEFCKSAHPEAPMSETVRIQDGKVQNVFVVVKSGDALKAYRFSPPADAKVVDQTGCMYVPHVQGVQVGQKLTIRNSDPIMHNVNASTESRQLFNFAQAQQGQENEQVLRRAEMVSLRCDVHGWMGAYVGVVDHPFFAVSGEDGTWELPKLPAGTYEIEAWHEKFGTKTATVEVADGATEEITFTFTD